MAKKFLGKVVAGAALGGAALLVGAPGIALADDGGHHRDGKESGQHREDNGRGEERSGGDSRGGDRSGGEESGGGWRHDGRNHVFTYPKQVRAGQEVTLGEVCSEEQEDPYIWSEATGRLDLEEAPEDHEWTGRQSGENGEDGADNGGSWGGKEPNGRPTASPSPTGSPTASPTASPTGSPSGQPRQPGGGMGGGIALDGGPGPDGKGYDGKGRDGKGYDGKGYDGKGREDAGRNGADHYTYLTEYRLRGDVKPGQYELKGSCAVGVLHVVPNGAVAGGTGGDLTNKGLAAGGAGALAAAALAGVVLLRRRRADGSIA
ncbi:PT domain-containing protein [Plantactinospora sp. GCM10030261]|uniref:PT domain-containing protein n=1 Tax=Plantactinospora sp. GCM10030261 TaxID=3273420 RepID=UPI003608C443